MFLCCLQPYFWGRNQTPFCVDSYSLVVVRALPRTPVPLRFTGHYFHLKFDWLFTTNTRQLLKGFVKLSTFVSTHTVSHPFYTLSCRGWTKSSPLLSLKFHLLCLVEDILLSPNYLIFSYRPALLSGPPTSETRLSNLFRSTLKWFVFNS